MKKQRQISILMTAAVIMMVVIGCSKQATNPPPTVVRNVVMRDSVFDSMDPFINHPFKVSPNDFLTGLMSLSSTIGHNPSTTSIVADSNNSAMLETFTSIDGFVDTMAGIEFYMMAAAPAQTNFITFLGKENGSYKNATFYFGMGFDKSDSVKYVYSTDLTTNEQSKNIKPIQINHWYKCNAEFTFADTTVTYYLDDVKVGQVKWQFSKIVAVSFDMFVAYRNGDGAPGPAQYYVSDLTVYKK